MEKETFMCFLSSHESCSETVPASIHLVVMIDASEWKSNCQERLAKSSTRHSVCCNLPPFLLNKSLGTGCASLLHAVGMSFVVWRQAVRVLQERRRCAIAVWSETMMSKQCDVTQSLPQKLTAATNQLSNKRCVLHCLLPVSCLAAMHTNFESVGLKKGFQKKVLKNHENQQENCLLAGRKTNKTDHKAKKLSTWMSLQGRHSCPDGGSLLSMVWTTHRLKDCHAEVFVWMGWKGKHHHGKGPLCSLCHFPEKKKIFL